MANAKVESSAIDVPEMVQQDAVSGGRHSLCPPGPTADRGSDGRGIGDGDRERARTE